MLEQSDRQLGVAAADGYKWWIERLRSALCLYDFVRIDHSRGFEAYRKVPGNETTAINGNWVKGPGCWTVHCAAKRTRPSSHHRRELRRDDSRARGDPPRIWIPRHGHPAVCLRQRPASGHV